ncbi:MAG: DUF3445 domain-containing protein [Ktedonobacterales bacterium]|nr:DUF3445 domain-containing protein [Ktedonobacterales bacterium]
MMLPYFPFDQSGFTMAMGVQPLALRHLIEVDAVEARGELHLKRALLDTDAPTYAALPPSTMALQWDALSVVLPAMATRYPHWFTLRRSGDEWHWHNALLDEATRFAFGVDATLPHAPLEWLGRQVQEDLVLLAPDAAAGFPLVGGVLCFPNMWSLGEKLGQPLMQIHQTVPGFAEHVGRSSALLFARMKQWHPVWRLNWSILPLPRLNLVPQFFGENTQAASELTLATIGARCHLRIERQTLTRLPMTGAILFGIHTYQMPLEELTAHPTQLRQFAAYLPTIPADMLHYKGIDRFSDLLREYLRLQLARSPEQG